MLKVSVPRILGIIALLLFIIFVAAFFTVLVRLSRIGVVTERYAVIESSDYQEGISDRVFTRLDILGQDSQTGQLRVNLVSRIDVRMPPFNNVVEGTELVIRVENLFPDLRRNVDIKAIYSNPTGDNHVNIDFGEFRMDIVDHRDFYPFDGYEMNFNFAYYIPGNEINPSGTWYEPEIVVVRSLTNLILLNPRYGVTTTGDKAFKMRVARLRIIQFITGTLILIQILFMLYLLTIINLQELLTKSLGYLVGLYIIREILVTRAPQFPTLIDYSTLFLICVVFFMMLFKFLGGAEERSIITIPQAWREAIAGLKSERENGKGESGDEADEHKDLQ